MAVIRLLWVALGLWVAGGFWAHSALADEADAIYDPSRMYVVALHLPQSSRDALAVTPFEYQPGTFSVAESTDETPDGVGAFSTPVNVGIRLKGSYSFRPLSGKSAFKIKFAKTELFHGIRVLTLNNMIEDPSMIHETLTYTAFRGSGVPGSRTGYAYVYVDGVDYGVHLNIETIDRIALTQRFGSFDEQTQHLYEGENAAEVYPGGAGDFEVDEGDENDRGDLEALIAAVNSSGPQPWAERVASVIDLEEMTRMWAVEKYVGQWDGYAGMEASWLPNNYYLYSDPYGVFQMLPWGNDESWQAPSHLPFDGPAGLMFDRCLEDEACMAIYRDSVAAVRDAIAGMDLDALAVDTAAMLAPWQEMEVDQSSREKWGIEEIEDGVAETREFVATRPAEVTEWLEQGPPVPKVGPTAASPAASESDQWLFFPPASTLRVGRTWIENGVLHTKANLRAGGVVTQRAKILTGEGAAVVCRSRVRVKRPRRLTLLCRLSVSVQELLRQRAPGLTVTTRFLPAGGSPERVTRRITLPRK